MRQLTRQIPGRDRLTVRRTSNLTGHMDMTCARGYRDVVVRDRLKHPIRGEQFD